MNAFAISLYDKFDELGVLLDIIRHNWEDTYYISVCSNHPDAEEKLSELNHDPDHFERGSQIHYEDPTSGRRGGDNIQERMFNNLHYRIFDSFRTATLDAIKTDDVDSVMHLHADAWVLDERKHKSIISEMKEQDATVAYPGLTSAYVNKYPPGFIDDQFILFDAEKATNSDFFERRPLDFPPASIHKLLSMICLVRAGFSDLYQYTSEERIHWDGEPATSARPMFYRPDHSQVHIAKEDFPNTLAKSLQAHYLNKHNLDDGKYIDELLQTHLRREDNLNQRLNNYIQELNNNLKWFGLSTDSFSRDVRQIEEFNRKSIPSKIAESVRRNSSNSFIYPAISGIYNSAESVINWISSESDNQKTEADDTFIKNIYAKQLREDDFPEEMKIDYRSSFE